MFYTLEVAGVKRDLPICKVSDDLYIAAFVILGDAELSEACARELLKVVDMDSFDYMLTAEAKGIPLAHEMARQAGDAKGIPLIHEMARQSGAGEYILARKGAKVYMPNPLCVEDESITTSGKQRLYLGQNDVDRIRGKRILIVDDVISTGGSLHALETLVEAAGGTVAGRVAILAEGGAKDRTDIQFLEVLPLFNPDGTIK